jgi:hypothetical protein
MTIFWSAPHILSVTESSKESLETVSKSFPMVSYAVNLFTRERMLYCNAVKEVAAICEAKLFAWHFPSPKSPLASLKTAPKVLFPFNLGILSGRLTPFPVATAYGTLVSGKANILDCGTMVSKKMVTFAEEN